MSDLAQASPAAAEVRFTIGRTFALTFGVLGRNFGPMALLALVITGIQSGIDYLLTGDVAGGEGGGSSFLTIATYALITAPVTYATFQDLRGTKASMQDIFARGFGRVMPVLLVSLALSVMIVLPMLLVVGGGFFLGLPMGLTFTVVALYVIVVFIVWFVVIPVQVVERTKFFAGFGRAAALTRGQRWRLLGLLLVYVLLIVALAIPIFFLVTYKPDSQVILALALIPCSAFYSVMGAILPAVVYYLLRAQKEGINIDEIARVFD